MQNSCYFMHSMGNTRYFTIVSIWQLNKYKKNGSKEWSRMRNLNGKLKISFRNGN